MSRPAWRSPSRSSLLAELDKAETARKAAEGRATVLAQAAVYLVSEIKEVIPLVDDKAAWGLEAAIYRYEERIKYGR